MKKVIALTAVVTALAAASAAFATPPTTESRVVDYGPFTLSCGSFDIEFWGTQTIRETTYYDQAGGATRIVAHVQFTETDRNTESGEAIQVRGSSTDVFDLVTGTHSIVGQIFMVNVPGSGAVIQDTGKIVFNSDGSVIVRGPHEVFESQAAIFCDVLK